MHDGKEAAEGCGDQPLAGPAFVDGEDVKDRQLKCRVNWDHAIGGIDASLEEEGG